MKAFVIIESLFFLLLFSCNNSGKQSKKGASENDLDAARNFLDAALKGDYKNAAAYMVQDSTNLVYLNMADRIYKGKPAGEKDSLRTASLRFYDTKLINDSTTITVFSNSYKNKKDNLKIVRTNGQWLVDLKYLFEHDMDTTVYKQQTKIDTIHK
ncbi:MAG: hypothetical protein ACHQF0_00950 [Chitinophagales bacterium]